ncbi:inosine monophosphate dehydrogenase-related protein [Vibrio ishigakensis]|uniref:Inosine monophosphate dehydrogenase-related protein n=1 Tax=Vibrio ishigakensis TaxID=1481914 RepID=A0A0B8QCR3_9VIBR|nr:CBS domain-containing protein [Vibrio ishigakensis]GAM57619.1 inosine monophosphate dehydrogenase-related protein [Vibrio ishigakensis]GAM62209.1 inosine monophosphate dehydrogenase-related protein [Vibrio ishigakensis]GAM68846.1 inosine monophosphate dehydrogenase-related protein [Vibrio sp. JCM 19236]GAM76441.1 inosine monophosphate dehydrogenase-related protein [Vibrio ishigakensis]
MQSLKVKDYMSHQAVTFTSDMSLSAALEKFLKAKNPGGPVIDESEKVVGFLSEQDLLEKLIKVSYHCQDTHIVSDVMYEEVLSVHPDMSIIELAEMMKVGKPKVYPVVDEEKLVGIISRSDVLRALGESINACFQHPV